MFPNRRNLARLQEELLKRTFYICKYNTLTINDLEISLEKLLHKLEKVNRDLKNGAYETKSQDNKVKKDTDSVPVQQYNFSKKRCRFLGKYNLFLTSTRLPAFIR